MYKKHFHKLRENRDINSHILRMTISPHREELTPLAL